MSKPRKQPPRDLDQSLSYFPPYSLSDQGLEQFFNQVMLRTSSYDMAWELVDYLKTKRNDPNWTWPRRSTVSEASSKLPQRNLDKTLSYYPPRSLDDQSLDQFFEQVAQRTMSYDAAWELVDYLKTKRNDPNWNWPKKQQDDLERVERTEEEDVGSARTSGSGRPFEGKVTLKSLLESDYDEVGEKPLFVEHKMCDCGHELGSHGFRGCGQCECSHFTSDETPEFARPSNENKTLETESFDKFMNKIVIQESHDANRKMIVEDSAMRKRAARHQERPAGRIRWSK